MNTTILKVIRAFERPNPSEGFIDLVNEGFTPEEIAETLSAGTKSTFTIRGQLYPNNRIRVRALFVVSRLLCPSVSLPEL